MSKNKSILFYILFTVVFSVVFFLYQLPVAAVGYAAAVCGFLGLVILAADYRKFCRKRHQLQLALHEITVSQEHLPEAEYPLDADYQNVIKELVGNRQEIINEKNEAFAEMMEYYTLWVHQIKTPISSMRLTLQNEDSLLARKLSCDLSHIEQYVEMVLAFLRLDSNSSDYVFKMHELDPLLRQSIRRFSSEFINRKLILSYTPPSDESGTLKMITDDKWFCFVIEQLLSNALKYTRAGTISIFFSQPKVLCLKDTGIGIAPQDLPRIFEKGYTGCNGRTDKKASGLGLYLCKRICKNLGIGISITSEVDNGTCVYLSLDQYPLKAE